MTANLHLVPILDAYAALDKPGFALMIDAPWGAGKTHAVKEWLRGKTHVYVSLFGLASPEAIEERLFDALVGAGGIKPPKGVTKIFEGVVEKTTGVQVDVTGYYRRSVLKNLPSLLVFDDLERAQMPAPLVLSVLNRFVEHEGRQVVLIANEKELGETADYRRWREKVVGRTVKLVADAGTALPAFLNAVQNDEARRYLDGERDVLRDVFEKGGTQNLRLLRQSVLEFAGFYTKLPMDIKAKAAPMRWVLADFSALAVAFHKGDGFGQNDLRQKRDSARASTASGGKKGEESPPSPIALLRKRFENFPHVLLDESALPGDLAAKVIADGHASEQEIETAMRESALFRDEFQDPWITLWWWRGRTEDAITRALLAVDEAIEARKYRVPEIILHVFAGQLDLARHSISEKSVAETVAKASAYINALEYAERLPDQHPASRWRGGLDEESAYGLGYAQRDSTEFAEIRDNLKAALDRAFIAANPKRLSDLLARIGDDPVFVLRALEGGDQARAVPDLSDRRLLQGSDPAEIARALFSAPSDHWRNFLSPFRDRIARQENVLDGDGEGHPSERDWMHKFRDAARAIAAESTRIRKAQIECAIAGYLSFLDPPAEA